MSVNPPTKMLSPTSASVLFIFSAPLVNKVGIAPHETLIEAELIDYKREREVLEHNLRASGKRIKYRAVNAAVHKLVPLLKEGVTMIHYAGHGWEGGLLHFESFGNSFGVSHPVNAKDLRGILAPKEGGGGQSTLPTKIVFVSTCHSEITGQMFVDAGVPHVVCVEEKNKVQDSTTRKFTEVFYHSLFLGSSVKVAYDAAISRCRLEDGKDPPYLLLPLSNDPSVHNECVFANAEAGSVEDTTPKVGTLHWMEHHCGGSRSYQKTVFLSRQKEMQDIMNTFGKGLLQNMTPPPRLISLIPQYPDEPRGIGLTTLAEQTVEYLLERNFFDLAFFVPFGDYDVMTSAMLQELEWQQRHEDVGGGELQVMQVEGVLAVLVVVAFIIKEMSFKPGRIDGPWAVNEIAQGNEIECRPYPLPTR